MGRVFFTEVIKDSDVAMSCRGELGQQLRFSPYGRVEAGMANPPLGALAVKTREALRLASNRHPVFASAWKALKPCSEHANWVAVVEVPK